MAQQATAEENAAYRAGLCRTCKTVPYSAGRTRCEGCHSDYVKSLNEGTA